MKIVLTITDAKKASRHFLGIASTYPAKFIEISDLTPQLPDNTIILADFLGATSAAVTHLKELRERSNYPLIAFADPKNRQQVMQARELGCRDVIDRTEQLDSMLLKLRKLIGDYARPKLLNRCSPRMAETVTSACSTYSQMSSAALTGGSLPLAKLKTSVDHIANTVEAEGLNAWLSAVELHHSHTFCHTLMVTGHVTNFGQLLGLSQEEISILSLGGLVHDLGKVKIPLSILDKPGKLTATERELVNRHPVFSREILKNNTAVPAEAYDIAVSHHEYLDGSGYPDGLKASEISELVRITTICDIYSALTEKRAYKDAMSPRQAFAIMLDMKGKLDDGLLRKFRDAALSTELGQLRRAAT